MGAPPGYHKMCNVFKKFFYRDIYRIGLILTCGQFDNKIYLFCFKVLEIIPEN